MLSFYLIGFSSNKVSEVQLGFFRTSCSAFYLLGVFYQQGQRGELGFFGYWILFYSIPQHVDNQSIHENFSHPISSMLRQEFRESYVARWKSNTVWFFHLVTPYVISTAHQLQLWILVVLRVLGYHKSCTNHSFLNLYSGFGQVLQQATSIKILYIYSYFILKT